MSTTTIIIALTLLGLAIGSSLLLGAPVFAIPIVAVVLLGMLGVELGRRRGRSMESVREEASAEQIEFTARDKQTLAR